MEFGRVGICLSGEETARERQSRVVRAGGKWENYVKLFLLEKIARNRYKNYRGEQNT